MQYYHNPQTYLQQEDAVYQQIDPSSAIADLNQNMEDLGKSVAGAVEAKEKAEELKNLDNALSEPSAANQTWNGGPRSPAEIIEEIEHSGEFVVPNAEELVSDFGENYDYDYGMGM